MQAMYGRLRSLVRHDAAPGALLVIAAVAALAMENSPAAAIYDALLGTPLVVRIGELGLDKPLLLWINDGLMTLFFVLVGLEIKRELLHGRLTSWRRAALPASGALGGMIVPALIYAAVNYADAIALRGWAIPAATDIAFVLAVLVLVGPRLPSAVKVFLLALAIIDDIGAIVIIAAFYTAELSVASLAVGGAALAVLVAMNLLGVGRLVFYVLVGLIVWLSVLKSGVHATLAGVLVALTVPLRGAPPAQEPPLVRAEHALHPWVAFAVLPAFAFANAGVPLVGLSPAELAAPIPLGIMLGLFVGKQLGVFAFAWAAVRAGLAQLPPGVSWPQVYGAGLLAGIGFTMSLFIGTLAFADAETVNAVRLGVLSGSLASALAGYATLRLAASRRPETAATSTAA